MNKLHAEIGDAEGNKDTVFDIAPDLANAFVDAIRNSVGVNPPRQAQTFDDLVETIAQTSRLIQHLDAFRELAMAAADRTSPHADRKAIAIAAGMPPSRLYRVLRKHGRPTDRRSATEETAMSDLTAYDATELRATVFPGLWDAYDKLTDSVLRSEVGEWGQVLAVGNSSGGTEYALIGRRWNADRTGWASDWELLATPETIGGAQGAAVDYADNGSGN
jgi:hypothetical protein